MRTLISLLMPLLAGISLTFSHAAAAADMPAADSPQEKSIRKKPALPPQSPTVTTPLHEISAPEGDASAGPSRPPAAEEPPASGETDEERANRVKDKFRERPGFQEDPPEPRAMRKGVVLGGIQE